MALVPKDKMTTLFTASQSAASAASALEDNQLMAVAYAINSAVNCGETKTEFVDPLLPATIDALKAANYTVKNIGIASSDRLQLISW